MLTGLQGLFGMNIQLLQDSRPSWYYALYISIGVDIFTAFLNFILKFRPRKCWQRIEIGQDPAL